MTLAATLLALAGLGVNPASADTNVYTTPGYHTINGRDWHTTCEQYSSTVERCRAEIWATIITRTGNTYRQSHGWAFNNLTYLPSSRQTWGTNPLAVSGLHDLDGRLWRVECDTPRTGRNGCRAYIWSSMHTRIGNRYVTVQDWQFNNIVLFTDGPEPGRSMYGEWVDINTTLRVVKDAYPLAAYSTRLRDFMADIVRATWDMDDSCGQTPMLLLDRYHGADYATGAFVGCDGYRVLWGVRNGGWQELASGQDFQPCSVYHQLGLPQDSGLQCWTASNSVRDW